MRNFLVIMVAGLLISQTALADAGQKRAMQKLIDNQISEWVTETIVIDAIKAQNYKHSSLSQAEIDRLDKQWRAETRASSRPMIETMLATPLSEHLKGVKRSGEGLYTEIFVMDNRGLNVGQSDMTTDYWQGDEAKWKNTFLAGPGGMLIDDVEFDESTQTYQSQVSLSIIDPDTKEVIGSITVGVNVELLQN